MANALKDSNLASRVRFDLREAAIAAAVGAVVAAGCQLFIGGPWWWLVVPVLFFGAGLSRPNLRKKKDGGGFVDGGCGDGGDGC